MDVQNLTETVPAKTPIDFLWLELTNQCNLQCTHCYAESGPQEQKGTLSAAEYARLIADAFELGCRRVQFIGGEPTLNRDLQSFITMAHDLGYEFIEVFTNLTRLSEELVECFKRHRVHIATSVYASAPASHDLITQVPGSFDKTKHSIQRLIKAGIPVRASIVEMAVNSGQTESTTSFLRELGVTSVGVDRLRRFGRGAECERAGDMTELCGNCANGTLCISPNGEVSPCIMSKQWKVGSVSNAPLSEVVNSAFLRETRQRIYDAVLVDRPIGADCPPVPNCSPNCAPYCGPGCNPRCGPTCNPQCGPSCRPSEPWR